MAKEKEEKIGKVGDSLNLSIDFEKSQRDENSSEPDLSNLTVSGGEIIQNDSASDKDKKE